MTKNSNNHVAASLSSQVGQQRLKNGNCFGYELLGHGRTKVFFFHGFPAGRLQGRLLEKYCQEFDLQIATFDRPGYGLSEFKELPQGYGGLAGVLEEVSELWGWESVHLIALSGGAPYALSWAARSRRIASLQTVCGLGPLSDRSFRDHFSQAYLSVMKAVHLTPEFALNALMSTVDGKGKAMRFAGYDLNGYLQRNIIREAFRQGVRGAKHDLANYLSAQDIDWKAIKIPTTVWHGTADNVVPHHFAKRFKELIPHAELHLKAGESHYSLPLQNARSIMAQIERLS